MKNIAGDIIRRLLALTVFLGFSAIICCGTTKSRLNEKSIGYKVNGCCCNEDKTDDMRPSQLVSIRIMQLI